VIRTADVVIVGGGVTGVSIAFSLAARGVRNILVLERRFLASGGTKSARLDPTLMPPETVIAPLLGVLYVFIYSLLSFDLIMSLSPVWRSTLFGWFFFAGCFLSAVTAMALVALART
jgi:hypothetical protein